MLRQYSDRRLKSPRKQWQPLRDVSLLETSKQKPKDGVASTLAFGYRGTAYALHVIDIESVLGRNNIVFDVDATGPATTVGDCISAAATGSRSPSP